MKNSSLTFTFKTNTEFINAQLQSFFSIPMKERKFRVVRFSFFLDEDFDDEEEVLATSEELFNNYLEQAKVGFKKGKYTNFGATEISLKGKYLFNNKFDFSDLDEEEKEEMFNF